MSEIFLRLGEKFSVNMQHTVEEIFLTYRLTIIDPAHYNAR
jgi:hypothetical protein